MNMRQQRIIYTCAALLGLAALVAIVLSAAALHDYATDYQCSVTRVAYDNSALCDSVTSLLHLDAWLHWTGSLAMSIMVVCVAVLMVVYTVYMQLGGRLQIRGYDGDWDDCPNYKLRDDFVVAGIWLMVAFIASAVIFLGILATLLVRG